MENENKLYLLLGEMSADIKNILQKCTEQDGRLEQHSSRLTALERFQWKIIGGTTAISTGVAFLVKFI